MTDIKKIIGQVSKQKTQENLILDLYKQQRIKKIETQINGWTKGCIRGSCRPNAVKRVAVR
ncbi:MAG: hypothetical protein QNK28_04000 [Desulfobacterales bacterium]|nr:hypothetical protein [Desulfobacterales bacterium]